MRKLRRFYTPERLAEIYGGEYDHTRWPEHVERVRQTIVVANTLIEVNQLKSAADLSAGDRAIAAGLRGLMSLETSDGDIEGSLVNMGPVDLFVCTETIEHLEAPWTVLERIAEKTRWLVLSCPHDEPSHYGNYEHYWSFDAIDVDDMLACAGFEERKMHLLTGEGWTYEYQLWTARSTV